MTTTVVSVRGKKPADLLADENFIYVGRAVPRAGWKASEWGNPVKPGMTWEAAMRAVGSPGDAPPPYETLGGAAAVRIFTTWLMTQERLLDRLHELKGKTLGCWCCDWPGEGEPDKPCHAVVLARMADVCEVFSNGKARRQEIARDQRATGDAAEKRAVARRAGAEGETAGRGEGSLPGDDPGMAPGDGEPTALVGREAAPAQEAGPQVGRRLPGNPTQGTFGFG